MSVIAFATLSTARNGDISSSFWLTEQLDAGREGFVRGRGRVRGCRSAGVPGCRSGWPVHGACPIILSVHIATPCCWGQFVLAFNVDLMEHLHCFCVAPKRPAQPRTRSIQSRQVDPLTLSRSCSVNSKATHKPQNRPCVMATMQVSAPTPQLKSIKSSTAKRSARGLGEKRPVIHINQSSLKMPQNTGKGETWSINRDTYNRPPQSKPWPNVSSVRPRWCVPPRGNSTPSYISFTMIPSFCVQKYCHILA